MLGVGSSPSDYANYQGAGIGASALNKPREIGLIDRASGISGGLSSLLSKLETLSDRITGQGDPKQQGIAPSPPGLPSILALSEEHLRRLHQIIDDLNNKI